MGYARAHSGTSWDIGMSRESPFGGHSAHRLWADKEGVGSDPKRGGGGMPSAARQDFLARARSSVQSRAIRRLEIPAGRWSILDRW